MALYVQPPSNQGRGDPIQPGPHEYLSQPRDWGTFRGSLEHNPASALLALFLLALVVVTLAYTPSRPPPVE